MSLSRIFANCVNINCKVFPITLTIVSRRSFLIWQTLCTRERKLNIRKHGLQKLQTIKSKIFTRKRKKDAEKIVPFDSQNLDNTYSGVVFDESFTINDDQILILKEKVINEFNESERQLLYDRYTLKKSISQIAEEYNTTENNIYQKIFRLKTKAKMIIDEVLNKNL